MLKKIRLSVIVLALLSTLVSLSYALSPKEGNPWSESGGLPAQIWRFRTYFLSTSIHSLFDKDGNKQDLIPNSPVTDATGPFAPYLGATHVYGVLKGDGKIAASGMALVAEYGFSDYISGQILIPIVLSQRFTHGLSWEDNSADDAFFASILYPPNPYEAPVKAEYPDQSGSGVGDTEIGVLYKVLTTEQLELGAAMGLRLPTGKKDDPNSDTDLSTGDGQYDLGFHVYYDVHLIKKYLSVGGWVKYEPQLEATYKYPAALGGEYKKDLGDMLKMLVCVYTPLSEDSVIKLGIERDSQGSDKIEGNTEADTNSYVYYLQPRFEWQNMKSKIPYQLTFQYDYPLAGKNVLVAATLQIGGKIFLKF